MALLALVTIVAAIIGGLIGCTITYLLRGYTTEFRRRKKLIEILLHIRGELINIQRFIDEDVLIPFSFD